METIITIILAILLVIAVCAMSVGYVVWRDRRRAEAQARREATAAAWGETDPADPDQQAQRPIWRPD